MQDFDLWDKTVLLMATDAETRHSLRQRLVSRGFTVFDAASRAEALELLADEWTEIHLIVVDLELPDLSGLRLAEILRGVQSPLPVLLLSPHTDGSPEQVALADRGWVVLAKPLEVNDVVVRCSQTLAVALLREPELVQSREVF